MDTDRDKPEGWQWTHERNAELIKRDGLMCEQHPGLEFDHDGCAGPGMAWVIEGRDAIATALANARAEVWKEAIEIAKSKTWWGDKANPEYIGGVVAALERAAGGRS